MSRWWRMWRQARRLLALLLEPEQAAQALLERPRVKQWLEAQPEEDQRKIREAAPLVLAALLAALD